VTGSFQHLRREIFSEAKLGEWSGKFCRDFKGKFCQSDREFESYLLRQLVHCSPREISVTEFIAQVPRLSPAEIGVSGQRERRLENAGAFA
jgi:hypothetical protein